MADSHMFIIAEWEDLLAAAREHEADLPELAPFKTALERVLEHVNVTKALQINLESRRRQATRDYHDHVADGRELVMRLRSLVKAAFGRHDARLGAFGIKPPGRRGRKPPERSRKDGPLGYH